MRTLICPRCAQPTQSSPCEACQLAFDFSALPTPVMRVQNQTRNNESYQHDNNEQQSSDPIIDSAKSLTILSDSVLPVNLAKIQNITIIKEDTYEGIVVNDNNYHLQGDRSLGGYQFLSHLATGGMGVAWIGERNNKKVVIKTPRHDHKDAQLRFTREVQALSTCRHQNIVSLLDIDITYDHKPLIVIDYIPGKNLREYINQKRLSVQEFETVGYQLALAIDHCHRRGIIHRDIKPENIMFNGKHITLIDFSLALIDTKNKKDISHATPSGYILGTPPYASPEQLRQPNLVNTSTDIYSYGILLDECIHNTNIQEFDTVRLNQWMKIIKQCCKHKIDMRPDIERIIHFCNINKLKKINTIEKINNNTIKNNTIIYIFCILLVFTFIYGSTSLNKKDKISLNGSIDPNTADMLIINHKNWNTFIIKTDENTRIKLPGSKTWQTNIQVSNYNTTNVQVKISDPDGKWSLTVYRKN